MNKTIALCVAAAFAAAAFADANPFAKAKLSYTSDKDGFYAVGEEMRFTIRLDGVEGDIPEGCSVRWFRRGDDKGDKNDKCVDRGSFPLPLPEPCVWTTSLDRPGFVHFGLYLVDGKGEKIKDAKGRASDDLDGGAEEIARRARGTPRIANNLLRRVRDYAQVKAGNFITGEVARESLGLLEIDPHGLDEMDRRILETICLKFGGGPVGLSTIAVSVGEEPDTIEEAYEPFLIMEG